MTNLPAEAFREMDRRDEQQMIAEYNGELIEEFAYEFEAGGRRVRGLSYAGTKELAMRLAYADKIKSPFADFKMVIDVECEKPELQDLVLDDQTRLQLAKKKIGYKQWDKVTDEERDAALASFGETRQYYVCRAVATNLETGRRMPGFAEQDAHDAFAWRIAASKASRNAIRALLPEITIKAFVRDSLAVARGETPQYQQIQADTVKEWAESIRDLMCEIPSLADNDSLRKTALENVLSTQTGGRFKAWTMANLKKLTEAERVAIYDAVQHEVSALMGENQAVNMDTEEDES